MPQFSVARKVKAPAEVVWGVISDVEGYADIAPNLSKAVIESGQGLGMQRRCWDTQGGTWTEQCTLWDEGRAYAMTVDTSDYPYPFTKMQGTWQVDERPDGNYILMTFDYQPKGGPIGIWLTHLLMKPSFRRICDKLLDNWQAAIEHQIS